MAEINCRGFLKLKLKLKASSRHSQTHLGKTASVFRGADHLVSDKVGIITAGKIYRPNVQNSQIYRTVYSRIAVNTALHHNVVSSRRYGDLQRRFALHLGILTNKLF